MVIIASAVLPQVRPDMGMYKKYSDVLSQQDYDKLIEVSKAIAGKMLDADFDYIQVRDCVLTVAERGVWIAVNERNVRELYGSN